MKKFFILFSIVLLLNGCGAGGGGNNTNPPSSTKSTVAKIKINKDGIYSVSFSDLSTASVDLSGIPIASLKMTNNGEEIAIDVMDVNNNGIFDNGDYIEFYGKAIQRGDPRFRYTETNVYWLSGEDGTRMRMEKVPGNSNSSQGASSFLKPLHNEEDTWYEQKNYPEVSKTEDVREHWFWGEPFSTLGCRSLPLNECKKRAYNFSTYGLDQLTNTASITLRLQSVTGAHHIKGYINGNLIIDKVWSGAQPFDIINSIPASYLKKTGQNALTIESIGDTESGGFELFYLDWFDVAFYHVYQAEHDNLEFTGSGAISVSGFSSGTISVYDITGYPVVRKILADSVKTIISDFKAEFSVPQDSKFIALTSGAKQKPIAVEAYTSADLKSNKDIDYIIITHEDFYDAVKPLADYRSNKGYKVLTVKTGDIYDEFGYGIETPDAVKAFLSYAYKNWTTKPKYVLLVGDATIDYKDISGYGKNNGVKSYVPAYLYNYYGLGEVPSDNWFADVDKTNGILPDMNIGRIPAKTAPDVTAVIDKIISHEKSSASNNILLVADDKKIFTDLSNDVSGIIPGGYIKQMLYKENYSGDFRQGIIGAIDAGALIVNYTGHGAVDNWTQEGVFSSQDIETSLNKNNKYPFVVALNCLNGYFVLPDDGVPSQDGTKRYPSIAESFLLVPEKGAVAVFAASSIGYPSEHDPLATALYSIVFEEGTTLGGAVTKAKEVACNYNKDADKCDGVPEDVVQTFIFFGDPATRLK